MNREVAGHSVPHQESEAIVCMGSPIVEGWKNIDWSPNLKDVLNFFFFFFTKDH